ncbi:MarP family serine protease [Microbacterium sp.]|uniref:MarP family serine protease n=1 Tax=Microbacterium sp. TaxID=51671 RepID=UPI003C70ACE5
MLVVDVVALVALLAAFIVGVTRGLFASLGAIAGTVLGALGALWLVPLATPFASEAIPADAWRSAALAGLAVIVVLLGAGIGAGVGGMIRRGVDRTRLRGVERIGGGVVGIAAVALALLIVGAGLTSAGIPAVSAAVGSSQVLRMLDRLTPAPLDDALAQVGALVIEDGLPRIEQAIGGSTTPTDPPIALDDPELQTASASVARISGTAYACGTSMTGSGFVAGNGLVVTNAHVVAGVQTPIVELPSVDAGAGWFGADGSRTREGRIVYFDPLDDLAVIAVDGLDAGVLPIADPVEPGTQAAVQGYPLGGPFSSSTADVIAVGEVRVPDIYDRSAMPRAIYTLDADVQPGNSGGPLLSGDGEVIGVVFARGEDGERRGYAMTTDELRPVLAVVNAGDAEVSSGECMQ